MKILVTVIASSLALFGVEAGAADAGSSPKLKAGWSDTELSAFVAGCVSAVMIPAKRDYEARAAQAGKPGADFPDKLLRSSVEPMCSCLGKRIVETWTFSEFLKDSQALSQRLVMEAISGGQCKPEGFLGDVLAQAQKKG